MADISKVTLPSGTSYDLKDAQARTDIATLKGSVTGAMHYVGVSATDMTDEEKTTNNVIQIVTGTNSDGTNKTQDHTAASGDVVIYKNREYIFSDSDGAWHEFGSTGSLKALAFKDTATGTATAQGSVSQPGFHGSKATISTNYTPGGAITSSVPGQGETATYVPNGAVSAPTFTGKPGAINASYTPKGNVSAPGVTVTPNTTTVNSITGVGSLPNFSANVSNETLVFGWNAGSLPTSVNNVTVVTGIKSATATAPTFTGAAGTATGSYTPNGTVSAPSFTGTGTMFKFAGNNATISAQYTPAGTVDKPSFTGTPTNVTVK